jgi:hypothetical protein
MKIRPTLMVCCLALLGMLCVAGSGRAANEAEHHFQRHATVGETIRIRGHVNYHTCGLVINTTITVVRPPTHGTLATKDEIVNSVDPELGYRRCKGFSGEGKVVYYTRTSSGPDSFYYTSSSANGVVRMYLTVD